MVVRRIPEPLVIDRSVSASANGPTESGISPMQGMLLDITAYVDAPTAGGPWTITATSARTSSTLAQARAVAGGGAVLSWIDKAGDNPQPFQLGIGAAGTWRYRIIVRRIRMTSDEV